MKFADKLFLWMTLLLTFVFTCFGLWMLSSNFSRLLNREVEQCEQECGMFQYLFDMGYHENEEYGQEYAISRTMDSIADHMERDLNRCFIVSEDFEIRHGEEFLSGGNLSDSILGTVTQLQGDETYAYCIHKSQTGQYYLWGVCQSTVSQSPLYLGLCRDISMVYEDRQDMMNQYAIALVIQLVLGGTGIYFLSRYITAPIRRLKQVAGMIAKGDFERRATLRSNDEIGELSDSFNQMTSRLVQQMKEKEDFTAAFAHELKTPLTSIIGYADMLNTMRISEEESREALYYIYSQGKRLESLSHKLLELVSLEKHPMVFTPIQTKTIATNIQSTMRIIWKQKSIQGKVSMDKGTLYGDIELLLSVFYNLLDNAVKAVEPGGFVLMKGTKVAEGYEIRIVDNGRGIPEDEIARITEAFYMVDKSRSRKEGGAGIGMALCKRIIELHHARLTISSKLGMGTVMEILFPEHSLMEGGSDDEA